MTRFYFKNFTSYSLQANQDKRVFKVDLAQQVSLDDLGLKEDPVTLEKQDKMADQDKKEIKDDQEKLVDLEIRVYQDVREAMAGQEEKEIRDDPAIQVKLY